MAAPGGLYEPLFGERDVAACLSDQARVQAMLDVEVALADALARVDVVPAGSGDPIRQAARAPFYDLAALATDAPRTGSVVIPPVADLTRRVPPIDAAPPPYGHWGA